MQGREYAYLMWLCMGATSWDDRIMRGRGFGDRKSAGRKENRLGWAIILCDCLAGRLVGVYALIDSSRRLYPVAVELIVVQR